MECQREFNFHVPLEEEFVEELTTDAEGGHEHCTDEDSKYHCYATGAPPVLGGRALAVDSPPQSDR